MHSKNRTIAAMALLGLSLAACSKPAEESKPAAPAAIAPTSAHGSMAPAPATEGGALQYTAPPEWVSETPTSSMRKAQYKLPRVAGDPEDAELVVFYFSGSGGGVQANIDRWIGQFSKPDGSPATDAATTRKREVGPIKLTVVDVSGTYHASSGMMLEDTKDKKEFRMLGAVAEASSGPWFFKLTGPAKTVAKWQPAFDAFLDSLKQ